MHKVLTELPRRKPPDLPACHFPGLLPIPVLVHTVCLHQSLADSAGPGHHPSAGNERLAHRKMHIYSPQNIGFFFFQPRWWVQQYTWRRELLLSTWLLVSLGQSQAVHVLSPKSLSKSLQWLGKRCSRALDWGWGWGGGNQKEVTILSESN